MDSSIYRLRTRDVLTLCVLALLIFGIVMVQSASQAITGQTDFAWSARGKQQAIFAGAAFLTFLIVGAINYSWLAKKRSSLFQSPIFWILLMAGMANLLVLVPHIGVTVNGARRWIKLGPTQIQPSELAKWAVVVFLAYCLAHRPVNLDKFFGGFLLVLVPVGLLCLLIVIQDFGTATLIAVCAITMLLAGRVKLRHLLIVIPPALAIGFWFVHHKAYRWQRITAFANPYAAPQKEGYHMIQSLLSFSTGGITGRGLGNGIQKLGYLPENTTDFIFATICEELGVFGAMLTIALYLGIIYVAWQTLREKRDDFGRLLAFGIGSMVGLQALINIAVATVSVPTKGLSLPLISAGGSGLVITAAALGLLYSVAQARPDDEVVAYSPEDQAMAMGVLQKLMQPPVAPVEETAEKTPAERPAAAIPVLGQKLSVC